MAHYGVDTVFGIVDAAVSDVTMISPYFVPSADEDIEKWPPVVRQLKAADFDAVCRISGAPA